VSVPGGRIAWCLTGAGHLLEECLEEALARPETDFFLSRAAEEVLRMYRLEERLAGRRVLRDRTASSPASGRFAQGVYRCLVVAPATTNTEAKTSCPFGPGTTTSPCVQDPEPHGLRAPGISRSARAILYPPRYPPMTRRLPFYPGLTLWTAPPPLS
jgi:hypothetical protein